VSRVDVGGEHLDGPALAEVTREDAVIEAAISLVEAWLDADDPDQEDYRTESLPSIRFRFDSENRVPKGEMTAASLRLLYAVTALQHVEKRGYS